MLMVSGQAALAALSDVHLLSAKSRIQPLRSYQLSCKQESIQHLLVRGMAAAAL
jgi:hypothetical protein